MNWALIIAAVFIPQASQLTLQNEPLEKGEAAYVESDAPGYARLYIGGDNGAALRVEDSATVHGYEYEYIDRTKMTILPGAGLTYSSGADKYSADSALGTYSLTIMAPFDVVVDSVEYTENTLYPVDMIEQSNGTVEHVIKGNLVTITLTRTDTHGELSVSGIKVRRVFAGNKDQVNDLTKLQFTLLDDLGEYNWRSLRTWVTHLYDYNRGEDWSRYAAKDTVKVNGQTIQLSANNRFAIHSYTNEVVIRAASHPALIVRASGTGQGYEGAFELGKPVLTAEGVDVPLYFDITDFDVSQLVISGGVSLVTSQWTEHSFTFDALASTLHIAAGEPAPMRFFQAYYAGEAIDAAAVEVTVPLKVQSQLYLKGDDDQIYRIKVTGGVLSAELAN